MEDALYRKINDRSMNSSTYHKKDGTPVRRILKEELRREIANPDIISDTMSLKGDVADD